jgi:CRISPR/Cas system endoribonuclease Cas6 (RAMP superfamily)
MLRDKYGYNGNGHKDVINRSSRDPEFGKAFQNAVLDARSNQILNSSKFVVDHCPIDNVAYLLSQVGHNLTEEEIGVFIEKAQETYATLSHVIIIKYSSDIPAIEDNQSHIANRYFQQYISDVFMGVYNRYFASIIGPRVIVLDFWNLAERESTLQSFLVDDPEFNF